MVTIEEKKQLIAKARKLGHDYLLKYEHCAPATLQAVSDTLDMKISDDTFKSSIGLSGYSGGCGGTCGGIASAGIYFGKNKEEFSVNPDSSKIRKASDYIKDKFVETYGGFLCDEIRMKLWGRLENIPSSEYMAECPLVCENAAGWAVEAILANKS